LLDRFIVPASVVENITDIRIAEEGYRVQPDRELPLDEQPTLQAESVRGAIHLNQ
jgi:hypothetical protein